MAVLSSIDAMKLSHNRVVLWAQSITDSLSITCSRLPLVLSKPIRNPRHFITLPVRSRCLKRANQGTVVEKTAKQRKITSSDVFEKSKITTRQSKQMFINYGKSQTIRESRKADIISTENSDGKSPNFDQLYKKLYSNKHSKLRQYKDVTVGSGLPYHVL